MNALQHTEEHYFTLSWAMLHIPIEITTNHTELRVCTWPSGKKSFMPPSGTIELHARLEFTGEPFPVGTTFRYRQSGSLATLKAWAHPKVRDFLDSSFGFC